MELPRPPPCVQPSEAKSLGRGNSDGRVILSGEGGAKREWAGPTLCGWANLEGRGQPRSFRANPREGKERGVAKSEGWGVSRRKWGNGLGGAGPREEWGGEGTTPGGSVGAGLPSWRAGL